MADLTIITESAIAAALNSDGFSKDQLLPNTGDKIHLVTLSNGLDGYRIANEPDATYFALIRVSCLKAIRETGSAGEEAYRRISRVIKGLKSPPVHLPRQWAEYHHRNLITFFALAREASNMRWIAELNSEMRCARFDFLTSKTTELDLRDYSPKEWPSNLKANVSELLEKQIIEVESVETDSLVTEVDLKAIGSSPIVGDRTYENWERDLTQPQQAILNSAIGESIRILGPAGSGKTLALCMRALHTSRDEQVVSQEKKILIATHSWAMAERIDGVLTTLNGGIFPGRITVFPLFSLLEMHAGHVGQRKTEVIGDDSTDGRLRSMAIIGEIVKTIDPKRYLKVSPWISEALRANSDSRNRLDLIINLYDEISGVLNAFGVAPDDPESIQKYIRSKREDWMPPFASTLDRSFVMNVYDDFIQDLIDRLAITTDQFILDSIRILETFTWRMRKETEGYDFIFVDELQLFDPQERSALELLGRSRKGVPFITAEDPSQGIFAALNARPGQIQNAPVYLDTVHRFNREIFELISFIYQRFPLNTLPLKVEASKPSGPLRPKIFSLESDRAAIQKAAELAAETFNSHSPSDRICLATLGDVDAELVRLLEVQRLQVTRLESFDDVERLAYSKRSIVVAPWQFVGGTQFPHVIVIAAAISKPSSQFGRRRELISIYLACSRAADSLNIVCASYVPAILVEAAENGLLTRIENTE